MTADPAVMTARRFVEALFTIVLKSGMRGFLAAVREPPGRRPPEWLSSLSAWMNGLTPEDQIMAEELARRSATATLRQVLSVLDGVVAIEPSGPKGNLRLIYTRGDVGVLLNDPQVESLEEMLEELHERPIE
jgi:hypothetical protein